MSSRESREPFYTAPTGSIISKTGYYSGIGYGNSEYSQYNEDYRTPLLIPKTNDQLEIHSQIKSIKPEPKEKKCLNCCII